MYSLFKHKNSEKKNTLETGSSHDNNLHFSFLSRDKD